jgi:hypothetical protein
VAEWLTAGTIKTVWSSPPGNTETVSMLLDAARDQVLEFAPVLAEGAPIPARYVLAQGMQARAIWEAHRAAISPDADPSVGIDPYSVRIYSMAKPIKDLLRPPAGPFRVG